MYPEVAISNLYVEEGSGKFTISLQNINGYVFFGLEKIKRGVYKGKSLNTYEKYVQ